MIIIKPPVPPIHDMVLYIFHSDETSGVHRLTAAMKSKTHAGEFSWPG